MNAAAFDSIARELGAGGICCERVSALKGRTTFRLGGLCPLLIHCERPEQLGQTVDLLHCTGTRFELIGGGSNLLVSDRGVDCPVICYATDVPEVSHEGLELSVSGSTSLDAVAGYAVEHGLGGFVNTSGIPGTVGGAIVGNAGAFGWQVGDALVSVDLLDRDGVRETVGPEALGLSYRDSHLKRMRQIVQGAVFRLCGTDPAAERAERQRILELRASKHPDLSMFSCAGSFFRNIEPTSAAERRQAAGYFLDKAGAKAMKVGGAGVYEKHANIIIKDSDDCSAQDILDLSRLMAAGVHEKFDIELIREAQLLGDFDDAGIASGRV